MHYRIEKYSPQHHLLWNNFVASAKNATFLFHRNFMEYHQDRFEDFSLLIYKNDTLISVFPANRVDNIVYSHQGLSYGGFLFSLTLPFNDCLEVVKYVLQYYCEQGISLLHLKLIPKIYHRLPADEIDYLLFLLDAKLVQRDVAACVLPATVHFSKNRLEGVRRGGKQQLKVVEETDCSVFWQELLIPHLQEKFGKTPVHSLQEIQYLKQKFPQNIRQFNIYKDEKPVAGTTIFESEQVAHAQYIASNADKNQLGSLDFLYHHLLCKVFQAKKYVDFGTSNQNNGRHVNKGLLSWKQGYGTGMVVHDFYEVATVNYKKLETVFV